MLKCHNFSFYAYIMPIYQQIIIKMYFICSFIYIRNLQPFEYGISKLFKVFVSVSKRI